MTWTDPTTRQTGDLITAAIWNQDVVSNVEYVYDRKLYLWFFGNEESNDGNYARNIPDGTGGSRLNFAIPDDVDTIDSVDMLVNPQATGTVDLDLGYSYHNPTASEDKDQHTGTASNLGGSMTQDTPEYIDLSSNLSSLDAEDVGGLFLNSSGGVGFSVLGLRVVCTRE